MPNYGHVSSSEEVIGSFQKRLEELKHTLKLDKLTMTDSSNTQVASYRVVGEELIELEYVNKTFRYIHPSQFDLRIDTTI